MLNQKLQQKLQQKLSPQQIQLMKLLQVPTAALEQRIKQEIEENPALEDGPDSEEENEDLYAEETDDGFEDDESTFDDAQEIKEKRDDQDEFGLTDYMDDDDTPYYKLNVNNTSPDDERKEIPFSVGDTFHEYLLGQLGLRRLSDREKKVAEYIIGNFDDSGYLQRELSSIVDDIAFSQNITTDLDELERLLAIIQEFDPSGVGARSLGECLILQLIRKEPKNSVKLAVTILDKYFEEFTKKHYDKIAKKLCISDEDLKGAIGEILRLNPKPGNSISETQRTNPVVIPDFLIFNNDGKLELSLNSRNAPELRVSKSYAEMLENMAAGKSKANEKEKETATFVKQKIDSAKWFIDAVRQRQNTLLATMTAIMNYQYDYFLTGDETSLKPMVLKDIAEIVNYDISTISRVVNSKYAQTNFGTIFLKTLFSESLQTDSGEEVSTKEVKKILEECIGVENKRKPLTDDRLTKILKEKGYNIARRTVAKYREQLNIPVARLRKEL
ncbi:MAG: RNA polymerase factor sigma-54 [Bacteroidota bacterium]